MTLLRDLLVTLGILLGLLLLFGTALVALPIAIMLGIVLIIGFIGFLIYAGVHDSRIEKEAMENEVPDIRGDSEGTEES